MRPIGLVLTTLLGLCGTLVLAQDLQQPPGGATQSQVADATANQGEAPLVYFNRTVTIFRVPLFGVSPEGRARRAVEVMSQLLDGLTPSIVTTQSEPQGNLVLIDGQLAFIIVEGDADRLRGQTLATNTEQTLAALRLVISETREVRDRSRLLRAFLYALGGTLALVAVVAIVVYVRRRLLRQLGRLAERAAAATHFGGAQVVTADRLLPIAKQLVSVVPSRKES